MDIKILENKLEKKCVKYAESCGYITYKLQNTGQYGVPDRLFIRKGEIYFIEFKREGSKARKIQEYKIMQLKQHLMNVEVVDNFETFIKIIK